MSHRRMCSTAEPELLLLSSSRSAHCTGAAVGGPPPPHTHTYARRLCRRGESGLGVAQAGVSARLQQKGGRTRCLSVPPSACRRGHKHGRQPAMRRPGARGLYHTLTQIEVHTPTRQARQCCRSPVQRGACHVASPGPPVGPSPPPHPQQHGDILCCISASLLRLWVTLHC